MNAPDYARIVARDGTRRRALDVLGETAKRLHDDKQDVRVTLQYGQVALANSDHGHAHADFKTRFELYTASDALKPQPPIRWEVEKLFREASVYAVVGNSGCKKTWSMLDLAVCKAIGLPWLGLKTEQSPVLLVDEESGPRRLNERLAKTLRGHIVGEETPIFYTSGSMVNLGKDNDASDLLDLIQFTEARMVIIDALADVMPGAKENTVEETQPIFLKLRAMAIKSGAAIIVIHHNNKQETFRGSTAIPAAVDLMLTVKSKPDSNLIEFGFEKLRDIQPFPLAAEARFGEDQFYLVETEHPKVREEETRKDELTTAIIESLEDTRDPMSTRQIYAVVKGNKAMLVSALNEMVKDKRVLVADGKHGAHLYSLLP